MMQQEQEALGETMWQCNSRRILFSYREEGVSYVSTDKGRIIMTGFISGLEELNKLEGWINGKQSKVA
jgi:hypothetical protein